MGWLFMPFTSMGGHKTAKSYLDAQLTYERTLDDGVTRGLRVLASSCPGTAPITPRLRNWSPAFPEASLPSSAWCAGTRARAMAINLDTRTVRRCGAEMEYQ
jgi:hypothetical protein